MISKDEGRASDYPTIACLGGASSKSSILKIGRCFNPFSLNGTVGDRLVIDSTLKPSPLLLETLLARLRFLLSGVQPPSRSLADPLRLRFPCEDRPKKYKLSSASDSDAFLLQLKMLRSSIHSFRWLKKPLAILGNENWLVERLTLLLALGLGAILKILSAVEVEIDMHVSAPYHT